MTTTAVILLALRISIMLSVVAVGLKVTWQDATYLLRHPRELVRAFLAIDVLMPVLASFLALGFNLTPPVEICLVALAISPVPPIFPSQGMKTGGKEEYVIGLLVATSILAIAVIPLALEIFEHVTGTSLGMSAFAVAKLVLTSTLAPLLVGIFVRSLARSFAERIARPIALVALTVLVVSSLPVIFASGRAIFSLVGNGTLLSMSAFALVGLVLGHFLGGPERKNRRVLALATGARHPGIAVAIVQTNFPEQKLVLPAIALYLIVSGILSALYTRMQKDSKVAPEQAGARGA